jgi:superoxide reductase
MIKKHFVYKCAICGNMTEVLHAGGGTLSCCGQPMNLLEESNADSTTEKHVPFIGKTDSGYLVKVGEMQDHPMMEAHYILWIELQTDKGSYKKFLNPGDKPQAEFTTAKDEIATGAREYCNLHGLWKS